VSLLPQPYTWTFTSPAGKDYKLEYHPNRWLPSRGQLYLNGHLLEGRDVQRRMGLNNINFKFPLEDFTFHVFIYSDHTLDLAIDGYSIYTGQPLDAPLPVAWWAWILIALMSPIMIYGCIKPINGLIALFGMEAIAATTRSRSSSTRLKIILCGVIFVACWAAFLLQFPGIHLIR
jgi:hypothetical protein